jgi:hypothetical protein
MSLHEQPLFTREMERHHLTLPFGSAYLHGAGAVEERGELTPEWVAARAVDGVKFFAIQEDGERLTISDGEAEVSCYLNQAEALQGILRDAGGEIYLDITSVTHRTWAPLLRAAIEGGVAMKIVYLEPASYRRSTSPAPGLIYDLSERIDGISPLPGFARVAGPSPRAPVFVPLLGFEGARLSFMLESVQAPLESTFAVVGVPGFRPEYPFVAYAGNRTELDGDLGRNAHLAKANCPFDLYHALYRIRRKFPDSPMKIAPIGTKPHAVGAVLFALAYPEAVEIVYDNPVRSSKRTEGEARLCLYDIPGFVGSSLFQRAGEFDAA